MKRYFFFYIFMFLNLFSAINPLYLENCTTAEGNKQEKTILYPANRVQRAGILWLNITNCGHIGNTYLSFQWQDHCTGKSAPSAEMPGGSGNDYLYVAALQFGGYLDSAVVDINGVRAKIFQGPLVSTGYEGSTGIMEILPYYFDEDITGITDGRILESSNVAGKLNCLFEEVYDPKATAYEQFTTGFTDKGKEINPFGFTSLGYRENIPLGIEVKQVSYAWPYDYAKKFVIVDYTIYNRNTEGKDIYDFFMGIYVDSDIKNENESLYGFMDDLCGYKHKWDGYVDPATGERKTVDMNLIWTVDNDGREYMMPPDNMPMIEPGSGSELDGAPGSLGIRVLRNPNSDQKYSFNLYNSGWTDEQLDWGPRWKTGLHSDWEFDLTRSQKGYDDSNYDSLYWYDNPFYPMQGGRTEGTPYGDTGHYMIMSNGEFDYDLTDIREVYLGVYEDPEYMQGEWYAQADKWQPWIATGSVDPDEYSDGTIESLNDIANGVDQRYQLSFGPLGNETYIDLAVDTDGDFLTVPDSCINKKVWKFEYGDSLKLTLAYIVSEDFNISIEQDPNYADESVVDLTDGLDKTLYDQGWYDALYNVTWAERLFDVPMFDTPVTRWGATKKDGWFGEDVGADGIFGDLKNDSYCWWLDEYYTGSDEGENDFILDVFTEPVTDINGDTASGEDDLLPYGRQQESQDYGITGDRDTGEGYGYMVKYNKLGGTVQQGSWVRYGYGNGKLDAGDGVPDFTCPPPPPAPKVTITEEDNDIVVQWCSHEFFTDKEGNIRVSGPEFTFDPFTRIYDFEGYEISISPDRQEKNYSVIFSVDNVNYAYQNVGDVTDYLDIPVPADTLNTYPEEYPPVKTVNGKIYKLVSYGDNQDLCMNYEKEGLYSYSCVTAISPYPEWGNIRYYRFVFHNQTLAQQKYIGVAAKDYGAPKLGVPPMKSSPVENAVCTVTSTVTTTDDVVVVPNPYRGDIDYRDMGWENDDGQYVYAEEYRKIAFLNIPERCLIKIYTLTGDLCKTIAHNGNSDSGTPYWYGKNGAYWNLINENHQAVMSGIYLFSVQDADKKKDDFVGKFVIIK